MPNFPLRLARLMTPPDAGTFQGQDGKVYPMADDRTIEVPDDYVPGLLARGYKLYEPPGASAQEQIAELHSKVDGVSTRVEAIESTIAPATEA